MIMRQNNLFLLFSLLLIWSFNVWSIPLDDMSQNDKLSDLDASSFQSGPQNVEPFLSNKKEIPTHYLPKQSLDKGISTGVNKSAVDPSKDKQAINSDDTDFYLFEQEELDAQKPGLEIYQSLTPMLTPEIKKDAKKIWADTAEFREALNFSTKDLESKELILQQSSKELTLLKGKSLEEIANKNLPPAVHDKKTPNKAMVRELFDGIYDLLKNAFFIIVGVLLIGKAISFVVKKIIVGSEKRKERKLRRHSKRRRKKHSRRHA